MASASAVSGTDSLLDLARRRWRIVVVGLVVGLVAAVGYQAVAGSRYVSSASVLVTATGTADGAQAANGQGNSGAVNLQTEAQLVTSTAVADRARTLLRTSTPSAELVRAVTIDIPANTSVLTISYSAPSAQAARQGAAAFADAYLANRAAAAQQIIDAQVAVVQAQADAVHSQLNTAVAQVKAAANGSLDRSLAQSQADVLTSELAGLTQTLGDLRATTVTPGRVIVAATQPSSPSGPPLPVVIAGGIVLGLILGIAVAMVRDRNDRRIRRPADVDRTSGLPVFDAGHDRSAVLLARQGLQPHPGRREFNRLANALLTALPAGRRVLLVAATGRSTAAPAVATDLAVALARAENGVTLVLAEERSSGLTRVLVGTDCPGLADVLGGRHALDEVVRSSDAVANLAVVGPGDRAEELSGRLQTRQAADVLASLRRSSDAVVVTTAPTTTSADAQTVARSADAAVLVVEAGVTRTDELTDAVTELGQVGVTELWCVLVRPSARSRRGDVSQPSGEDPAPGAADQLLEAPASPPSVVTAGAPPTADR